MIFNFSVQIPGCKKGGDLQLDHTNLQWHRCKMKYSFIIFYTFIGLYPQIKKCILFIIWVERSFFCALTFHQKFCSNSSHASKMYTFGHISEPSQGPSVCFGISLWWCHRIFYLKKRKNYPLTKFLKSVVFIYSVTLYLCNVNIMGRDFVPKYRLPNPC